MTHAPPVLFFPKVCFVLIWMSVGRERVLLLIESLLLSWRISRIDYSLQAEKQLYFDHLTPKRGRKT